MHTLRKVLLVFGVVLFIGSWDASILHAAPSIELKAAFVRGGDLWMKNGDKETQLTKEAYSQSQMVLQWKMDCSY